MVFKKFVYGIYKKMSNSKIVSTAAFFAYHIFGDVKNISLIKGKEKSKRYYIKETENPVSQKDVKVVFVCDDMTYKCFSKECDAQFVTPYNWREIFDEFKPYIFFCESAWSGISEYEDCWRGRVYKNNNVLFETRKALFDILDYCNNRNIKTVFWNKEDPTYFGNLKYDFVDTALRFDYIFTTCAECVDKYKKLGKDNVDVLQFGFTPEFFNPLNSFPKENFAVFAGSWYANEKERCRDMESVFDSVLNKNIPLRIYDRYFDSNNLNLMFPEKYSEFNRGRLPFDKLGEEIKKAKYAININTVKDSETMFARRVFELMACNAVVISNYSKGMKNMFGRNVWFSEEDFVYSDEILEENLYYVFKNHTNHIRFKYILERLGIRTVEKSYSVLLIYIEGLEFDVKKHFGSLNFDDKVGCVLKNGFIYKFDSNTNLSFEEIEKDFSHFVIFDSYESFNFEKVFLHYSYIDDIIGIRFSHDDLDYIKKYTISFDCENHNTLFRISILKSLVENFNLKLKKYTI